MITRKPFLMLLTTSALALALVTTASLVEGKGKPAGGGGSTPPPGLCLTRTADAGDRPFKGHAEGVIDITSVDPMTGVITAVVNYTGKATHLGKFTRQEFLTIDGPFVSGYVIFTAANGDELYLDFSGMFVSGTVAEGTYFFDGGTGRFEDATGEADFVATSTDFVNISVTFDGTLNY